MTYSQERDRAWKAANPEKLRANRERGRAKRLAYSKLPEVKERNNARVRARYANDPEYKAKKCADRENHRWNLSEDLTYKDLVALRSQDCFYCGDTGGAIDHLVPRSKGGQDRLDNLVPCCLTCNSRKLNRDLADFYAAERSTNGNSR